MFLFRLSVVMKLWLQEGFSEWRMSVWMGKWVWGPGVKKYQVQIEDPFDYSDNCGRTIGRVNEVDSQMSQIVKVFMTSWGAIRNLSALQDVEHALLTLFRKKQIIRHINGKSQQSVNFEDVNFIVSYGHDIQLAQNYKKLIILYKLGKQRYQMLDAQNYGPKLPGDLNFGTLLKGLVRVNPIGHKELQLRSLNIKSYTQFAGLQGIQSLDLSDNQISRFHPVSSKNEIIMLLLSNNCISRISSGLGDCFPFLKYLNLNNNQIEKLDQLEALSKLPRLQSLSLMGNPVYKLKDYRLYVIFLCRKLKSLDYKRIKFIELTKAQQMYSRVEFESNFGDRIYCADWVQFFVGRWRYYGQGSWDIERR
eukprot:TRINITY_DN14326_c2_g1_i1.p2 TRINITY_DN14326_c2_g1~~TRINITY_DN14326_c2_g1_i1.p2  ORF type:complete len:380 (-),score=23.04 TRINITY_DN14326_c2_g1_i1:397-1485(-)